MLIYNYQKEFLGIDEADLKSLGFKNLLELRSESADFADLFLKTPGYIHNFKHVHWIDFIDCAESAEDSKVVIHAKGKNYKGNIKITTMYLIDNPSQKAYAIHLTNLRVLSAQENEQIAHDVMLKPTPKATTAKTAIFKNQNLDDLPQKKEENLIIPVSIVTYDPYEADVNTSTRVDTYDIPATQEEYEDESTNDNATPKELKKEDTATEPLVEEDFNLDLLDLDVSNLAFEEKTEEKTKEDPNFDYSYVYDPKVASDELGLPIDLIEEFIGDFIAQAREFKDGLYASLNEGDLDNVKILSHKLKGVAANLRVEDAFQALTVANTSDNLNEIKRNLDRFYVIAAKLAGEAAKETPIPTAAIIEDDDDFSIDFKEEIQENQDEDDIYMDNLPPISAQKNIESTDSIDIDLDFDEENEDTDKELYSIEMPKTTNEVITYDKHSAANEIGIDSKSFDILFVDYINESQELSRLINSAIEQGDSSVWKKGALKLKGMSDNMRINQFSAELDTLINTSDTDVAKKALDKCSAILVQISNS
ncbi:MAG: hypothetical protein AUK54_00195 [Helicobacteraceae bacterium CG2_30_36_10]|nr:MAG: hypothetical protein AUK54_00195 [Helicobacteraceae bacterium CG2_30_36_10]